MVCGVCSPLLNNDTSWTQGSLQYAVEVHPRAPGYLLLVPEAHLRTPSYLLLVPEALPGASGSRLSLLAWATSIGEAAVSGALMYFRDYSLFWKDEYGSDSLPECCSQLSSDLGTALFYHFRLKAIFHQAFGV